MLLSMTPNAGIKGALACRIIRCGRCLWRIEPAYAVNAACWGGKRQDDGTDEAENGRASAVEFAGTEPSLRLTPKAYA